MSSASAIKVSPAPSFCSCTDERWVGGASASGFRAARSASSCRSESKRRQRVADAFVDIFSCLTFHIETTPIMSYCRTKRRPIAKTSTTYHNQQAKQLICRQQNSLFCFKPKKKMCIAAYAIIFYFKKQTHTEAQLKQN